jgi:ADP-heptose:LPS heptosyltransferase
MPRKIILRAFLSPGDICTLTAAVESLHASYPGQYITDVRTSCDEIFENNPHVTKLRDDEGELVEMHYNELLNQCNQVPNPFLRGYAYHLGKKLGIHLELVTNRPHIYLSNEEKDWINQITQHFTYFKDTKFSVVNAGVKKDITLKQWPVEYYQEVIDHFRGRIQFVQVGKGDDDHPKLKGVIDLVGKTTTRQLIRLVYHAQGGLGPITFIQHLFAAFEKPYVALLGGREPLSWTQYPFQTTLHTIGKLPCCRTGACWRARVIMLGDGDPRDKGLCEFPFLGLERPVGKCMAIIKATDAIRAIETCYEGGALAY